MNRLFITTVFGFLLALAVSAAVSYWLALNPPFQIESQVVSNRLEAMGERLFSALKDKPEEEWNDTLDRIDGIDDFFIDWYDVKDLDTPVEEQAVLIGNNKVLGMLVDGTPILELLFEGEQLVVELVPAVGYEKRGLLNGAATVIAVLLVGLVAALLTLAPTAKRLGKLQRLASHYRDGDFAERNLDKGRDSVSTLGHAMESMADQVQRLLADNKQLVDDQRELMRAVAHEFRAPMARMRFALEMNNEADEIEPEKIEISNALDELDGLVTEVLRYARLQHSAPALTTSMVSLQDMVNQAASAVQAVRPDILPDILLPNNIVEFIDVDPVQFPRALRNLISNALKYTDNQVVVRCDQHYAAELCIHVDDNGPGIKAEDRKRILEPFVRLDSSRTRSRGGTGLGLAIANGVMQKHGGQLQVSESPQGGARFTMLLPIGGTL